MKYIPLTQGKYAIADDKDFEWLNQWKWCYHNGYAIHSTNPGHIKMHRLINQTPEGKDTDHINGNKLDNRRKNLRTATHQQNLMNKTKYKTNTSGYRGISWKQKNQKWVAQIQANGKKKHLGLYKTIQEAWFARKQGEQIYFKEFRSNYL